MILALKNNSMASSSRHSTSPIIPNSLILLLLTATTQANSNIFRAYIGSQFTNIKFSDVPINPNVQFHFILAFAIDYTSPPSPSPTNGRFNIFWDTANLSPSQVSSIKNKHPNVRVSLALGGATVGKASVFFKPSSIDSWVANAVSSLTRIIQDYHLSGIDIDYEQFEADPTIFAECIGRLIGTLKRNRVISFASIAPFDDSQVQRHYLALWSRYGGLFDYVNFQFYAYDRKTTISHFLTHFESQSLNYKGGKVFVSYISDGSGGLSPENNFFTACQTLKRQNKLNGIFVWSADDSKTNGFRFEIRSQQLLASST